MIKVAQDTQEFAAQRAIGAGFGAMLFASSRTPREAIEEDGTSRAARDPILPFRLRFA